MTLPVDVAEQIRLRGPLALLDAQQHALGIDVRHL